MATPEELLRALSIKVRHKKKSTKWKTVQAKDDVGQQMSNHAQMRHRAYHHTDPTEEINSQEGIQDLTIGYVYTQRFLPVIADPQRTVYMYNKLSRVWTIFNYMRIKRNPQHSYAYSEHEAYSRHYQKSSQCVQIFNRTACVKFLITSISAEKKINHLSVIIKHTARRRDCSQSKAAH